MNLSKKSKKDIAIVSVVLVLAVIVMVLRITVSGFAFFAHPIFAFLFVLCLGLGVLYLVNGIIYKSPVDFFMFALNFFFVLTYLLIDFAKLAWWAVLIIDVVAVVLSVFLSLVISGNRTEDIALNEKSGYKTYAERKNENNDENVEK